MALWWHDNSHEIRTPTAQSDSTNFFAVDSARIRLVKPLTVYGCGFSLFGRMCRYVQNRLVRLVSSWNLVAGLLWWSALRPFAVPAIVLIDKMQRLLRQRVSL